MSLTNIGESEPIFEWLRYVEAVRHVSPTQFEDVNRIRRIPRLREQLFINIHRTLRMSPAMAAGVVDRLMDVNDLVNLLIEPESKKAA